MFFALPLAPLTTSRGNMAEVELLLSIVAHAQISAMKRYQPIIVNGAIIIINNFHGSPNTLCRVNENSYCEWGPEVGDLLNSILFWVNSETTI